MPPSSCISCCMSVNCYCPRALQKKSKDDAYLVLAVNDISTADAPSSRPCSTRTIIAPTGTALPIWTIASHMSSVATHTTYDVGGEVLLLGTIILAMADLSAVLARLVLVVTQGSVERRQFSELIPLQFVLAFGDRGSLCIVSIGHTGTGHA